MPQHRRVRPDLDQVLVTFTADFDHLWGLGADISRQNLASDRAAFAGNERVRSFLEVVVLMDCR